MKPSVYPMVPSMQLPYVSSPERALLAAQLSTACVLTAIIGSRPVRPWLSSALFVAGIWVAALAIPETRWLTQTSLPFPTYTRHLDWVLGVSSLFLLAAVLLRRGRGIALAAVTGAWLLDQAGGYLVSSEGERVVLQVIFGSSLFALVNPATAPSGAQVANPRFRRLAEIGFFLLGLGAASFVAVYVLDRYVASGDEWAYQYQADLFAHGKAYGPVPECPTMHMTYWIYYWQGRSFCQYTPSWPLVMAPFQRFGVFWLANPVVFGVLLIGVSRLARRAAGGAKGLSASRQANVASIVAPISLALSGATLLNAGSLFSHILVCGLFAWSAELLFALTSPGISPKRERRMGALLGVLAALLLGARPADGAAIVGVLGVYGLYSLFKGTLGRKAVATASIGFVLVATSIMIILRLQLGEWFRTGYSLADKIHPWAAITFHWPNPDEWKYGIPLATGAYCFWPCSVAVAAVGAIVSYRKLPSVPIVLCSAAVIIVGFYTSVTLGRHQDWGYGPRYVLPTIVPMAVFTGVALGPVFEPPVLLRSPLWPGRAGILVPLLSKALAMSMIVYGTWKIGTLLYPVAMREIQLNGAPFRAIKAARLKNAVVVFGRVAEDTADLTQNLATDPNPDVVYVMEREPDVMACGRRLYPDRKWYRAEGFDEVRISPLD